MISGGGGDNGADTELIVGESDMESDVIRGGVVIDEEVKVESSDDAIDSVVINGGVGCDKAGVISANSEG